MQIPSLVDPKTTPRKPAPPRADGKRALLGLSKADLREALIGVGIPEKQAKMRVSQVWNWIYQRGATEISAFANISKDTRALLEAHFVVVRPEVVTAQVSTGGTRKWLLRFDDGEEAECVFIPDAYRGTLCVSSQVGCTLNCRFCFTGTMKLVRNLTPAEIVGQVMLANNPLGEWPNGTASPPALPDTDDNDDDEDRAYLAAELIQTVFGKQGFPQISPLAVDRRLWIQPLLTPRSDVLFCPCF